MVVLESTLKIVVVVEYHQQEEESTIKDSSSSVRLYIHIKPHWLLSIIWSSVRSDRVLNKVI